MPVMADSEIIAEFAARRRRAVLFGVLPFAAGVSCALLAFWEPFRFTADTFTQVIIGWGIAVASLIPIVAIYRCPACGALVTGSGPGLGFWFNFGAVICPRCG